MSGPDSVVHVSELTKIFTVPAEAVTSHLEWGTAVTAVVFATVLFAFTRWFWRFGLRRYAGASA